MRSEHRKHGTRTTLLLLLTAFPLPQCLAFQATLKVDTRRWSPFYAPTTKLHASTNEKPFNLALNDFFKNPVPEIIGDNIKLRENAALDETTGKIKSDIVSMLTAPPGSPGVPRPLWLVIVGSVPTGLVWYGYYKFCIEEELLQMELDANKEPRGFGGYGTLGPFTYGLLFGILATTLGIPGGNVCITLAIVFIYYTQFLLYDRVNELYRLERGRMGEPPLQVWWCLPIFFPFNLIVGLRQVHFLSQYFYKKNGIRSPPPDPVAEFFPFIMADNFTWKEFFQRPSLWCSLLKDVGDVPTEKIISPLKFLMDFDDEIQEGQRKESEKKEREKKEREKKEQEV